MKIDPDHMRLIIALERVAEAVEAWLETVEREKLVQSKSEEPDEPRR